MSGDSDRIAALETRIAYQDETIEALNQTVTAQWSEIERLKRAVAQLEERLEDAVSGPGPVDRPPPHY
ncbi:SlyX family protein [Chelatococcus sambhunathii]|uniref:Protein SlyX homolog n=1 Tax=Chelatococcus sambhunathii TaxID=363953 RepID=A0ABU1DKZ5_9HYPH|nr:SlyX family protein [Chelatococcus sambhunathii]MDR4308816.1 SlyX family protein [Chelatococcus sambhunathii]